MPDNHLPDNYRSDTQAGTSPVAFCTLSAYRPEVSLWLNAEHEVVSGTIKLEGEPERVLGPEQLLALRRYLKPQIGTQYKCIKNPWGERNLEGIERGAIYRAVPDGRGYYSLYGMLPDYMDGEYVETVKKADLKKYFRPEVR